MQDQEEAPGITLNGWTVLDGQAEATVLGARVQLQRERPDRVRATMVTRQGSQLKMRIILPVPGSLQEEKLVEEVCRRRRPVDIVQAIVNHWTGADRTILR